MRKRIIGQSAQQPAAGEPDWFGLESMAEVEVTSEDAAHPIESALVDETGLGWRASEPGDQTIRLLFDEPQRLKRIYLVFDQDAGGEHTQEFALGWSPGGQRYHEILRQQYNFSPPHITSEVEDYKVDLQGVKELELIITPDKNGGDLRASLRQLRLA
jgi:hypothetical protein